MSNSRVGRLARGELRDLVSTTLLALALATAGACSPRAASTAVDGASPHSATLPTFCDAGHAPPDHSTQAKRPDEATASFFFPGSALEQREFVWLREDGLYDYAERWDWGVPGDATLQVDIGWDWKVGCQIERCRSSRGETCCYQVCEDGGHTGAAYEPPDRFDCMNESAGGRYQWFLDGLRAGGVAGLEGCGAAAARR